MLRKKILVFCDYYLPGYKSGGGMWTVVNLVERFADRYDFYVVTRNHDGKLDRRPYEDVKTGEWNDVGSARVFYVDRPRLNVKTFTRLIREVRPDLVFLNSVFSLPSINFLRSRKDDDIASIPVVLSPCGELSPATLKFKAFKKSLFLAYAKLAGLHRNVLWRASFETDADEIRNAIGANVDVMCAPDLPPKAILPEFKSSDKPEKSPGSVKLIFVSRIVRKKNLHFLFERLAEFTKDDISLEVVGPVEDEVYWAECQASLKKVPSNVRVDLIGALPYQQTLDRMKAAHFFVLPTLTENFGYVFIEAMASGCPLLISDRTVWNDVPGKGAGWIVPVEDPEGWTKQIATCISMPQSEYSEMSSAARKFAVDWLSDKSVEEATDRLLAEAVK
jgi:glycosyltransferase involved in cell wall biosynthesis